MLLNHENTSVRITALLPLLRDLLSIQVYVPADDGNARCVHSSEMDLEFARPVREHRPGDSELRAAIKTGGKQVLSVGWQRFGFTETLSRLRASAAWPTSWVREALQERQVPDRELSLYISAIIVTPELTSDWLRNVRFLGRYQAPEGLLKPRGSVVSITGMSGFQLNPMPPDVVMANEKSSLMKKPKQRAIELLDHRESGVHADIPQGRSRCRDQKRQKVVVASQQFTCSTGTRVRGLLFPLPP